MRPTQKLMICIFAFATYVIQAHAQTSVREENILLPIQIGSHTETVETLVVRPLEGSKFPIALIVNGSFEASPSAEHADWLAHLAHDFANRGFLAASIVWPGYGRSSGKFWDNGGTCVNPNVAGFLDAHGKELRAMLESLRKRSDVDPSLAVGVGISIGGASMLELAAEENHPLTAVINISGGVYHYMKVGSFDAECELYQAELVRNMAFFGKDNPTPTLWFYAENDPFFGPVLVKKMLQAYREEGGVAKLVALHRFGKNGHTLYKIEAAALLNSHIDSFLRLNYLPALDDSGLIRLLSGLTPAQRVDAQGYLQSSTEKALAVSEKTGRIYWHYAARTLDLARKLAVSDCQRATNEPCHLLAENMSVTSGQ
ncbi:MULTISPECIES: alpha/beta hydrolase family protein [Pseudomonas syringae group]|uniref:alpha/beta hydrolase family protein n=1 Tax=Pseudomonas syringae group TaxID=136849 RepID=UPI0006D62031|nr:hypothetical protein [Pseudomonas coronafaciens]KPX31921.1 Uncharacterized protein ALO77_00004 [Pseudomonas coronafaciens pv. garcae]RMV81983.1 hypothetical protein ALP02_02452 [Pseudomonas coronafaciens pv. garcae]